MVDCRHCRSGRNYDQEPRRHTPWVHPTAFVSEFAFLVEDVEIGEDGLVASGAILPENMILPPLSLVVGVPGRTKGTVAERHNKTIKSRCDSYIHKTERYKRLRNLESERK